VGVGSGLGNPSPLGAGLGVNFLSSTGLRAGDGYSEAGASMLKPVPSPALLP